MLNSLIKIIAHLCVALALLSSVGAQEPTRTPPPILKGGIVHQLRSLSDDAIEALQNTERGTRPIAQQPQVRKPVPQSAEYPNFPPQPTGRATLRRTNPSPWLERFTHQRTVSNTESSGAGKRPSTAVAASPNKPQQSQVVPAEVTPEQIRQLRADAIQANSQSANPPRAQRPAMLEPELYGEVYVAEELPSAVRHSIRDVDEEESALPSNSKYAFRDSEEGDSPDQELFPRRNTSETPVVEPPKAPQVSRIPLPTASRTTAVQRANPNAMRTSPAPEMENELSDSELGEKTLPTPLLGKTQSQFQPKSQSDSKRFGDGADAEFDRRGAAVSVPTQMVATPSAERRPIPALPDLPSTMPSATAQLPPLDSSFNDSTDLLPSLKAQLPMQDVQLPQLEDLPGQNAGIVPMPSLPLAAPPTSPAPPKPAHQAERKNVPVPSPNNTAATDAERMRMETPRIEVVLKGPADMPVGIPAMYEVLVTNRDNIDLAGLILRFDVPAGVTANSKAPSRGEVEVEKAGNGATLFTWAFQNLAAGQAASAPIEITASSPKNFGVAMEWTLMPLNGEADIAVSSPQLEMLLEGPSEVNFGEANTYRLHIRNVGNAAASNVAVRLSAGPYGASETDIGSIAAGDEETIDVELTFNQQGSIGIAASATASGNLSCSTEIDVLVKQSNLIATIDAPAKIYHGTPADYRITISNTGDADARNVTAVCTLPAGATLVRTPEGASVRDSSITWQLANLRAGMAEENMLQLNLENAGENRIHLECSTVSGLASDCWASTEVESIVDLKLMVNDPIAPAPVGTEVLYELTLTNRGSKAGNNVRVVAQFSDGIEPIRGEGQDFRLVPGQILFEPLARIEAGQSISLKVYARAEFAGSHRFRTEVRSDDSELKLVQEESTRYLDTATRIASPSGASNLR
jgi:uncharacterized repeat protein (TIGR01451 family)